MLFLNLFQMKRIKFLLPFPFKNTYFALKKQDIIEFAIANFQRKDLVVLVAAVK